MADHVKTHTKHVIPAQSTVYKPVVFNKTKQHHLLLSLVSRLADNGGNSLEIFTCQFLVDSYCSQRRLCFVQGSR